MKKKTEYRVRNWKEYNRSLISRGSPTFRISEELLDNWIEKTRSGTRGRSFIYMEAAILACLSVKFVFHQAGRQTSGLISSMFNLC